MKKKELSICMIVKDEEANLKRCLDSFLPIVHEKWSELVIVDTGSTDRTLEVAKEYTRKVYEKKFIPWDFSAARNYTISFAKGKKILIVDADEQLEYQYLYLLEDVILNPKFKKFKTIFLNIRSFLNKNHTLFADMMQPRIFANDGKFHYIYSVHNKAICTPPYLFINNIRLSHYGYQWEGHDNMRKRKKERSLPLLLKALDDPQSNRIHVLVHLVKTYKVIEDIDNTIKYGEEMIKEMRKIDYDKGMYAFLEGFTVLLGAYLQKGDISNALRVKNELERYSNRLADAYILLGLYYTGKDEDKAAEYFETALDITNSKGSEYEKLVSTVRRSTIPEIYNWLSIYHYQKGNFDKAGDYLNKGIYLNNNNLPLRWDIWNADKIGEKNAS